MRFSILTALTVLPLVVLANCNKGKEDPLKPITISAKGINATFIPFGARITSLFVNDKDGTPRDVVVGYDDPSFYVEQAHTKNAFVGGIVGRYANRIKNGTFEIGNTTYHVSENEHNGENTLHGGFVGYDQRNWTVTSHNQSTITFTLFDPAGTEGFPGNVLSHVTYTLSDCTSTSRGKLIARITSLALDDTTPIMLSTHIYWNIGSFLSSTVLNNTLQLPDATRIIGVDSINVPTGQIINVNTTSIDFTSPKTIGSGALNNTCGEGCTGIDNAFLFSSSNDQSACDVSKESYTNVTRLIWTSEDTGLTLSLKTNQQGVQLYTCNTQDGSTVSHTGQGPNPGEAPKIEQYGCMVIEPQGWIDAINYPEWGQEKNQIFSGVTGVNVNWAEYDFRV